jgi:glutamate/tyrosine decarboxylase-like PLP-dependent enzyme
MWFVLTCLAFGIFARVLPEEDDYKTLHKRMEGIELADSITVDGHKLLNVVSSSSLQLFTHDLTYM